MRLVIILSILSIDRFSWYNSKYSCLPNRFRLLDMYRFERREEARIKRIFDSKKFKSVYFRNSKNISSNILGEYQTNLWV